LGKTPISVNGNIAVKSNCAYARKLIVNAIPKRILVKAINLLLPWLLIDL
jgi:hypothetical protein